MKPQDSKEAFLKMLNTSGVNMAELIPEKAVTLMFEFYNNIRTEECELDQDGDMLLFEWGTFNVDGIPSFLLMITRQFILSNPDADQSMSQLSLKFYFPSATETNNIKNGYQWCHSPHDIEKFRSFIEHNEAYTLLKSVTTTKITLEHENV